MMLGDSSSTLLGSPSGDAKVAAAAIGGAACGGGGGGSNNSASEEDNKLGRDDNGGDRSFGGSRWLRQETLALLNIRSDMDQVFRDSSLKGPLWEEVSRKLAELGYNRSAKKCKEKFENVYKYHRRTKDGLTGKPEGKHYKFFDQLQALDHHHHHHQQQQQQPKAQAPSMLAITQAIPLTMHPPSSVPHINFIVMSSSSATPINAVPQNSTVITTPPTNPTVSAAPPLVQPWKIFSSSSTSSSTASEEYSESRQDASAGTRKRKWKMLFKRLTKQVIKKQEELQDKFLKEIERRERERIVREEAWRVQEMSRINREHEILIQERSTAAAKDAAVIAFLQKVLGQQQQQTPVKENPQPQTVQPAPPQQASLVMSSSSSRWPKAEVEDLIKFKTELANKYQENGPKGPLWEEVSAAMRSIGYNRNAKRCKEKWENINKYFKKVKESNKKRPEDSKTCPYFDQLDALYKDKSIKSSEINVKVVDCNMEPLMVQPEQQWPQKYQPPASNAVQIQEDDDEDEGDSEEDYEEDQEGHGGYEIVPKKAAEAAASTE